MRAEAVVAGGKKLEDCAGRMLRNGGGTPVISDEIATGCPHVE